jgi:hypothetical protein
VSKRKDIIQILSAEDRARMAKICLCSRSPSGLQVRYYNKGRNRKKGG